jgi:hypothetical protein
MTAQVSQKARSFFFHAKTARIHHISVDTAASKTDFSEKFNPDRQIRRLSGYSRNNHNVTRTILSKIFTSTKQAQLQYVISVIFKTKPRALNLHQYSAIYFP